MFRLLFLVNLLSIAFTHPFGLPVADNEQCQCSLTTPTDEGVRFVRAAAYPVDLEQISVPGAVQTAQVIAIESLYQQNSPRISRSPQQPQIDIQPAYVQEQVRNARSAQKTEYPRWIESNSRSVENDQLQGMLLSGYGSSVVRNARSAKNIETVVLESTELGKSAIAPSQTIYANSAQLDLIRKTRSNWFENPNEKSRSPAMPFEDPMSAQGQRNTRSIGESTGKIGPDDDITSLDPNQRFKTEELFGEWEKSNSYYINAYKELLDQQQKWLQEFHDWRVQKIVPIKPEMTVKEFLVTLEQEVHKFEAEEKKPRPSELDRDAKS